MKLLLDQLVEEHGIIDRVMGAMLCFAERLDAGQADGGDMTRFVSFLEDYLVGFHHRGEDELLFPALVEHAEVPGDRGPIAILGQEHRHAAAQVEKLAEAGSVEEIHDLVTEIAREIWEHVDKENSVLIPEARDRLARNGVTSLAGRDESTAAAEARRSGLQLVDQYPPVDDPEQVRGDGCVACSAYAETCHGVEKEWWNSWEWQYHRSLEEG